MADPTDAGPAAGGEAADQPDRSYTYYKGEKDKDFYIRSMQKYVHQKQELDKFLETLIAPVLRGRSLEILDACCGIGHLSYWLSQLSPESTFLGVDQTPHLIEQARELCRGNGRVRFELGDVYGLPARYPRAFDVALSWKTVSALPHYDQMLRTLFAVARKHIFLSALFYDGDIDFETRVREYQKESGRDDFNAYYNIYSIGRFTDFAMGLGARAVHAHDFEIGIDLPRESPDHMGTYTLRLEGGRRLQVSGAVIMSWKVIQIDL